MKLERVYLALAAIGFVGTGTQVLGYLDEGPFGGTKAFWDDALTSNDAARFLSIDIAVLGVAVFVLLFVEARRVGIAARWFWVYVVGSVVIGISTFVPLFLAHRQRRLDAAG